MSSKRFNLIISSKISQYKKKINVDTDKSISIRSFIIGSICENISLIKNVLESEDVKSTISCLKKLGVKITKLRRKIYTIHGKGLGSLIIKKNSTLNFGNSGTLARLLLGVLSTTPKININVSGDKSLNKRSMKSLIRLLSEFGATFLPRNKFQFPLKIISSEFPVGIEYHAGVSAQLKSAVILAGLNSYGDTLIFENEKSRNHTENILSSNSKAVKITNNNKKIIKVTGKRNLNSFKINIPGDPSSAAFFTALTILNSNSTLTIKNVGLNKTRTGFYDLLKKHGAKIRFKKIKNENSEIRGDILIKSCKIKPLSAPKKYYVNSTDEYPILFVIAALTKGTSVFKGIDDLANKESNRINEMQKVLKQIGVRSFFSRGQLKIFGKDRLDVKNRNIHIPNLGDHRICMSSFVLACITGVKVKIKNFETVFTSSPSFLKNMKILGAKFEIQK